MPRSLFAILALAGACGTSPDTRPETADYIIDAILVPYCGRGGCHSSATQAGNLEFDTIPSSLAALSGSSRRGRLIVKGDAQTSRLYTVLVDTSRPMPPDQPLAQADIDLIQRWIDDGAAGLP